VGVYAFWKQCNWVRIPCLVYATHVATTLLPILAEFWYKDYSAFGLVTAEQKAILTAIYLPYLLVPLYMMQRMILNEKPFGGRQPQKNKRH
jgi:sigma intracellular receptor 2